MQQHRCHRFRHQVSDFIRYGKYGEAVEALRHEKARIEGTLSTCDLEAVLESVFEDAFIRIVRNVTVVEAIKQFQALAGRLSDV